MESDSEKDDADDEEEKEEEEEEEEGQGSDNHPQEQLHTTANVSAILSTTKSTQRTKPGEEMQDSVTGMCSLSICRIIIQTS